MPRTLDPIAYAVRRDRFLDAAQALIATKGYEALSIQDVIAAVRASKGAFYHYFDSKAALLDAVVGRMVEAGLEADVPVVADPGLAATEKLARFAAGLAKFKAERREFLVALLEVWLSDENAVVRERFRRRGRAALQPVMRDLIRQGVAEGAFHVVNVAATARVFVTCLLGLNEAMTELYLDRQAGRIALADVVAQFNAFADAFNRILGAAPGTVVLADPAVLRDWFGDPAPASRPHIA